MKISRLKLLSSPSELAQLLNIPQKFFLYHLYGQQPTNQYMQWSIPKKNGGKRNITLTPAVNSVQLNLGDFSYAA